MDHTDRHHGLPAFLWLIPSCLLVVGCVDCGTVSSPSPSSEQPKGVDNEGQAERYSQKGAQAMDRGDLRQAADYFQQAIECKFNYGPAHNNLGTVYLKRHELFKAARAFQQAASLMPRSSQPLNNLGMVYEAAGQYDKAAEYYELACRVSPNELYSMENLARVYLQQKIEPRRTVLLLQAILLHETREPWKQWAGANLQRLRLAAARDDAPGSSTTPKLLGGDGPSHRIQDLSDLAPDR